MPPRRSKKNVQASSPISKATRVSSRLKGIPELAAELTTAISPEPQPRPKATAKGRAKKTVEAVEESAPAVEEAAISTRKTRGRGRAAVTEAALSHQDQEQENTVVDEAATTQELQKTERRNERSDESAQQVELPKTRAKGKGNKEQRLPEITANSPEPLESGKSESAAKTRGKREQRKTQRSRKTQPENELPEAAEQAVDVNEGANDDIQQESLAEDNEAPVPKPRRRAGRQRKEDPVPMEITTANEEPQESAEVQEETGNTKPAKPNARGRPRSTRNRKQEEAPLAAPVEEQKIKIEGQGQGRAVEEPLASIEELPMKPKSQRGRKRKIDDDSHNDAKADTVVEGDSVPIESEQNMNQNEVAMEPQETKKTARGRKPKAKATATWRKTRGKGNLPAETEEAQLYESTLDSQEASGDLDMQESGQPEAITTGRRGRNTGNSGKKSREEKPAEICEPSAAMKQGDESKPSDEQDIPAGSESEVIKPKRSTRAAKLITRAKAGPFSKRATRSSKKSEPEPESELEKVSQDVEMADIAEEPEFAKTSEQVLAETVPAEQTEESEKLQTSADLDDSPVGGAENSTHTQVEQNFTVDEDHNIMEVEVQESLQVEPTETTTQTPLKHTAQENLPESTPRANEDFNTSGSLVEADARITDTGKNTDTMSSPTGGSPAQATARKRLKMMDGSPQHLSDDCDQPTEANPPSQKPAPRKSARGRKSYPSATPARRTPRLVSPQSAPRVKRSDTDLSTTGIPPSPNQHNGADAGQPTQPEPNLGEQSLSRREIIDFQESTQSITINNESQSPPLHQNEIESLPEMSADVSTLQPSDNTTSPKPSQFPSPLTSVKVARSPSPQNSLNMELNAATGNTQLVQSDSPMHNKLASTNISMERLDNGNGGSISTEDEPVSAPHNSTKVTHGVSEGNEMDLDNIDPSVDDQTSRRSNSSPIHNGEQNPLVGIAQLRSKARGRLSEPKLVHNQNGTRNTKARIPCSAGSTPAKGSFEASLHRPKPSSQEVESASGDAELSLKDQLAPSLQNVNPILEDPDTTLNADDTALSLGLNESREGSNLADQLNQVDPEESNSGENSTLLEDENYNRQLLSATPVNANAVAALNSKHNGTGEVSALFDFIGGLTPDEFNNEGNSTLLGKAEEFALKVRAGQDQDTPKNSPATFPEASDGPLATSTPVNPLANSRHSIDSRLIEGDSFVFPGENDSEYDETSRVTVDYPEGDMEDESMDFDLDVEDSMPVITNAQPKKFLFNRGKSSSVAHASPGLPNSPMLQGTPQLQAASRIRGTPRARGTPKTHRTPRTQGTPYSIKSRAKSSGGLSSRLERSLFGESPQSHSTMSLANSPAGPNSTLLESLFGHSAQISRINENGIDDSVISQLHPYEADAIDAEVEKDLKNHSVPSPAASPRQLPASKGSQTPQAASKTRKRESRPSLPAKLSGFHQKLLRSASKPQLPGSPLKQCQSVDVNGNEPTPRSVNVRTPTRRSFRRINVESPALSGKASQGTPSNLALARVQQDLQGADESIISELNEAELEWLGDDNQQTPLKLLSPSTPQGINRAEIVDSVTVIATPRTPSCQESIGTIGIVNSATKPDETSVPNSSVSGSQLGTPTVSALLATASKDGTLNAVPSSPSDRVSSKSSNISEVSSNSKEMQSSKDESSSSDALNDDKNTEICDAPETVPIEESAAEKTSPEQEEFCVLSATAPLREVMSQLDPVPEVKRKYTRAHKFQDKVPPVRHSINTLHALSMDSPPEADSASKKSTRRNTLSGEIKSGNTIHPDSERTRLSYLGSPPVITERDILVEQDVLTVEEAENERLDELDISGERDQAQDESRIDDTLGQDAFLDGFVARYAAKKAAKAEEEQHQPNECDSPHIIHQSVFSFSPARPSSSPTVEETNSPSDQSPVRRSPRAAAAERSAQSTGATTSKAGQTPKQSSRSQKVSSLPVLSGKSKPGKSKASKSKPSVLSVPPPRLDLSVLVSPAPGEPPTLSQLAPRELAKITAKNTTVNALWENVTFEREVVQRDIPRPPSPNGQRQTAQANLMRKRRKAIEEETGVILGPGDDLDFVPQQHTPTKRRVKWDDRLESGREEELPRMNPKEKRGDTHKSVLKDPRVDTVSEKVQQLSKVKIVRYLYLGERDEYS